MDLNNIIMPHSKDAEKSIIASCLFNPEDAAEVCDLLTPDHFYSKKFRTIFEAIQWIVEKDKLPEIGIVADRLTGKVLASDLSDIIDNHPIAPRIDTHCELLIGYKIRRDAIEKSNATIKRALDPHTDPQDVLDYAESEFGKIDTGSIGSESTPVCEISDTNLERLERLNKSDNLITGVPTGYRKLDLMTCGLQNSDLIVIAGRPSMGKTALALNIVQNAAEKSNVASAIYSLEMSKEQLHMRLVTSKSRINAQQTRTGNVPPHAWPRLVSAFGAVDEWPVLINDRVETLGEIRRSARNLKRQRRIGLVVIDYLQLLRFPNISRHDLEIGDVTRGAKRLAKELDIPVVLLSQLNRKLEERSDKRPQLADLKESGAIEADADVVAFIYRDEVYNKDPNNPNRGKAELIIAKQRNGPVGTIPLTFLGAYTRFEDLATEII